jgi:hypothetical protein
MVSSGTSKTAQFELAEQWDEIIQVLRADLFGDTLPENLVLLPDRSGTNGGSFEANGWVTPNGTIHVIHANKDYFSRPTEFWMGWIIHNAAHAAQFKKYNTLAIQGYHDKIWAEIMEFLGLIPSDDVEKQGKKTGKVIKAQFPVSGGKFDKMIRANEPMLNLKIKSFTETNIDKGNRKDNKVNYYCPGCHKPVYGGRGRVLICVECNPELKKLIEMGMIKPMATVKQEE